MSKLTLVANRQKNSLVRDFAFLSGVLCLFALAANLM
jgi:hypothetical protein